MNINDIKNLTRKEKEKLLMEKEDELQTIWKNPPTSWDGFFDEMTDEQIEDWTIKTVGQLKFEKGLKLIKKIGWFILILIGLFVLL